MHALGRDQRGLAELFGADGPEIGPWLVSCRESLEKYFLLEDPRRLEPAERETYSNGVRKVSQMRPWDHMP